MELRQVDANLTVTPALDDKQAAEAGVRASRIAQAAAGSITLDVRVDRRALRRLGTHIADTVSSAAAASIRTSGLALAAGGAAAAIAGLASASAALIPVLAGIATTAASTVGVLIAVPGAIATAAAAVGVLKLGLIGLDDAFSAIADDDVEKFNKATEKLAPNARAFVKQVKALFPAFKALQLDVQNRLFAHTDVIFRHLALSTLPIVSKRLGELASTLNRGVTKAVIELNNRANRSKLSSILASATRTAANLSKALRPVGQAMLDVLNVSTRLTAQLSGGLSAAVTRFAERVSEMARTGELRELFQRGVASAKLFLSLLRDIGGVLSGIVAAAGGANGFGFFAFFDRLNEAVNSVEGQQILTTLFAELARIGKAVAPVFVALAHALLPVAEAIGDIAVAAAPALTLVASALGPALASLAPAIISLTPAVAALAAGLQPLATILAGLVSSAAPGVTAFIEGLTRGLQALAPVAPLVGQALGDLLAALAPVAATIGTVLAGALSVIAPLLSQLAVALTPVFQVLSEIAAAMAIQLLPAFLALARATAPLVTVLAKGLLDALRPLVPAFAAVARIVADQLIAALPQFLEISRQMVPVLVQLAQVFAQHIVSVIAALLPHLPLLVAAWLDLVNAFRQLMVAILPLLPSIVKLISLVVTVMLNSGAFQAVIYALIGAILAVTVVIKVFSAVVGAIISVVSTAINVISGLVTGTQETASRVFGVISGIPGKILSALGNLGTLLINAGKNVVQGLIDGIESKFGGLRNTARSMADTIRRFLPFSPAKEGPLSGSGAPFRSGQVIAGDVAAGVQSKLPSVSSAADELASQFGAGGPGIHAPAASHGGLVADWAQGSTGDRVLDALREMIIFRYGGDIDLALSGRSG